jgi:hypothetical protein
MGNLFNQTNNLKRKIEQAIYFLALWRVVESVSVSQP